MLISALLLGLSGCAPQASPSADGLAAVRGVLQRTEGTSLAREDYLVRRLVTLGPGVGPALFSLVSGEGIDELLGDEPPEHWLCSPDRIGTLALDALAELPQVPLRDFLRASCAQDPAPERRVAAWTVLGRQASADGIELVLELCAVSGDALEHRSLRDPAVAALAGIVHADAKAIKRLEAPLLAAPPAVQRMACEALAESARPESFGVLSKLLGKSGELDLAVLRGLAQLGERAPWNVADRVTPRLRTVLEKGSPRLRAAAAEALGRLKDGAAVPELIGCLPDAAPEVARAAGWALKEITGQTRERDAAEWRTWLEGERSWWNSEGQRRLEALADPESDVAGTLRALLSHPLGRDQIADALSTSLSTYAPGPKKLACQALAAVAAKRAVPALVELLFDSDPEVRAAAWSALRTLTGQDLPAEPRLWEEYAFG